METNTARNFALQLGALASLYLSLSFLIVLLFAVINLLFPDPAEGYYALESAQSQARFGIAMVLVFFPVYVLLTHQVNRIRRTETAGAYLGLTRWLIYLSLLIGGGVLLGDLVAVIVSFLEGELTQRFILKALAVLLVVGTACYYYLLDARGHWVANERQSRFYALGAGLVVLVALAAGFANIALPEEARQQKLDDRQVTDLMNIQGHVESYYVETGALPESLEDAFRGLSLPSAPEGREAYSYTLTGDTEYELCATFAVETSPDARSLAAPRFEQNYNWDHGAGRWCFTRVAPEGLRD